MKKIASIQMSSSANVDENLKQADFFLSEASQNNAKLVVLPEMFSIMGKQPEDKVLVGEKYGSGKVQEFLSHAARKYNIWIVGGTIPIQCNEKNKVNSACIVYNNTGDAVARYDKIHLFDVTLSETETYRESDTIQPGNSVVVVDTPVGKLGLAICYDIRFPELFRELYKRGAEIIAIPSAFTLKTGEAHWRLLTRARAVDTFSYIIASAQVGMHASGRQTYGHTLICDPWGKIISEVDEQKPGIIYAEIDLQKLYEIRKSIPLDREG